MTGYYDDPARLSYPDADRLVARYIESTNRDRTTSRDVLSWADSDDSAHNQTRIHDALDQQCERLDVNWAGRTVFQLPDANE